MNIFTARPEAALHLDRRARRNPGVYSAGVSRLTAPVLTELIESLGLTHPVTYAVLFLLVSFITLWRLEAMLDEGLEGTALGTLITPYFSGLGNLLFVFILVGHGGLASEVLTNCLVNNVTNFTLLLGIPALLWGLQIIPKSKGPTAKGKSKGKKSGAAAAATAQINRLSLWLTLGAAVFFSVATWIMAKDGHLDRTDGLMLIVIFLFWQSFQVYDVAKHNVRQRVKFGFMFYVDALVVLACAWVMYESIDWLVDWLAAQKSGFISAAHLGWLSGWLMVMPNALLALYWGWKKRADVVYTSQVGDGHVSIPLCLGVYAALMPATVPATFLSGILLLIGAGVLHAFCLLIFGGLPRWAGVILVAAYAWFVWDGLLA
ncbi:MAG TPA: sodium:calcium symporter [Candidatus Didemnitutus sp.]|nr:sodium:calcium symporter [Candidatus Didemnitutus sp.]